MCGAEQEFTTLPFKQCDSRHDHRSPPFLFQFRQSVQSKQRKIPVQRGDPQQLINRNIIRDDGVRSRNLTDDAGASSPGQQVKSRSISSQPRAPARKVGHRQTNRQHKPTLSRDDCCPLVAQSLSRYQTIAKVGADVAAPVSKRRKLDDDDLIDENSQTSVTWFKKQQFKPLSCRPARCVHTNGQEENADQIVGDKRPHFLDGKIQMDIMEVDDWMESSPMTNDGTWNPPTDVQERRTKIESRHAVKRSDLVFSPIEAVISKLTNVLESAETVERGCSESQIARLAPTTDARIEKQKLLVKNVNLISSGVSLNSKLQLDRARNGYGPNCSRADKRATYHFVVNKSCDTLSSTHQNKKVRPYPVRSSSGRLLSQDKLVVKADLIDHELRSNYDGFRQLELGYNDNGYRMTKASQSFQLIIDRKLRIVYASKNVLHHLGHHQVNMLGCNIEDYIHPNDMPVIRRNLRSDQFMSDSTPASLKTWRTTFHVAMRVCLPTPDSHRQEAGYMLTQWNVTLVMKKRGQGGQVHRLICSCWLARDDSALATRMDTKMFISRSNMCWWYILCNPRIRNLIEYRLSELIGQTVYYLDVPRDVRVHEQGRKSLKSTRSPGPGCYMFLSMSGATIWLMNKAASASSTEEILKHILYKNYVMSNTDEEEKYHKKRKDICDRKWLDFSLKTDLPAVESNDSILDIHQKPKKFDIDMLLEHFSISYPVNSYPTPSKLEHLIKTSRLDINADSSLIKLPLNMAPHSSISSAVPKCNQDADGTSFQQLDITRTYVGSMSKMNHTDLDVGYTQDNSSHLVLPKDMTANVNCFNHVSEYSEILNQFELMDTSLEQSGSHTRDLESGELHLTNGSHLSDQNDTARNDVELSGNEETETTLQNLDRRRPSKESYEGFNSMNSTKDVTDNNSSASHLSQTPNVSTLPCWVQENLMSPSTSDCDNKTQFKWHLQEHLTTGTTRNMLVSNLTSHLQRESIPSMSDTQAVKNGHSINVSEYLQRNNNVRHQEGKQSNLEGEEMHSTFNTYSSVLKKVSLVKENLSEPLKSNLQVSSSMCKNDATLSNLTPLTSHLLSPSTHQQESCFNNSQTDTHFLCTDINSDSEESSLFVSLRSKVAESDYVNTINRKSSILTNKESDPFFNQMSLKELNHLADMDTVDDLTFTRCTTHDHLLLSQALPLVSPTVQSRQCNLGQEDMCQDQFNSSPNFVDSLSSMTDSSFVSESLCELDTLMSPYFVTNLSEAVNTQSIPFTDHIGFDQNPSNVENHLTANTSGSGSTDSSDSENSVRASLLRTLLDKGGAVVQGPLTYMEWVLEKALKKKSDLKRAKTSYNMANYKQFGRRKFRTSKKVERKSVELPLPRCTHGLRMKHDKNSLQHRKPTKELPLPSSALTTTLQSAMSPQHDNNVDESIHQKNILDKDCMNRICPNYLETSNEDLSLPDDLLDMAMEYCASLGTDQPETLISDLNENISFEDNLYSFIGSPLQDSKSANITSTYHANMQPARSSSTSTQELPTEPFSTNPKSNLSSFKTHTEEHQEIPPSLTQSTRTQPSQSSNLQTKSPHTSIRTISTWELPPACPAKSTKRETKFSLLRAAVTSPDVDRLIQQIPLASSNNYNYTSHLRSEQSGDYPDIEFIKNTKLQKHWPQQVLHDKLLIESHANTIKPQEKLSLSNPLCAINSSINASDYMDAFLFDNFYKSTLSQSSANNEQQLPDLLKCNTSRTTTILRSSQDGTTLSIPGSSIVTLSRSGSDSTALSRSRSFSTSPRSGSSRITLPSSSSDITMIPRSNSNITTLPRSSLDITTIPRSGSSITIPTFGSNSTTLSRSGSSPIVLKISIHPGSPAKVINVCKSSKKSIKEKCNTMSSQETPKEAGVSTIDLSTTHPVSVMIMRKENHRSRRSKNIAVQTENEPSEVYPEFEHNDSDTFLYPSVLFCSNTSSVQCVLSPVPTPGPSPPSISELEKFLCSHSSPNDSCSHSTDEGFQTISNTPFLQRLLMGELNKDQYQRLDQRILEEEKKLSISSANE